MNRFWKDRSRLIRIVGTLVSLILLYLYIRRQDWDQLLVAAFSISISRIVIAFILFLMTQILNGVRWWFLLRSVHIHLSFFHVLRISIIGIFTSNFLPSTIGGDLVRLVAVSANVEMKERAAASVIIDRLLGLLSRFVLLPFSLPLIIRASPDLFDTISPVILPGMPWFEKLKVQMQKVFEALGFWIKHPRTLLAALCISWIGLAMYICGLWVVARELGIDVTMMNVAAVMGITYFITLLPISLNGFGLRELGMVTLYVYYGGTLEQATALALITRVLIMAVSFLGAFFLGAEMETIDNYMKENQ